MAYRDAVITLDEARTTYAQTVDKAWTTERVENQTWRENAGRREQRRSAPPQIDSDRGSSDQQKRKVPSSSVPSGPSARGRGAPRGRQSDTKSWRSYPLYERCHRCHYGKCQFCTCYTYESPGYCKKDCP